MTVPNDDSRIDYIGNGIASTFTFPFKIFSASELIVERDLIADREQNDTLILNTDYTVTGAGDEDGGSIAIVAGALASIYGLHIRRVIDLVQELELTDQGPYTPDAVERQFDRSVMMDQQQQEQIDRSFKMPANIAPSVFSAELPADLTTNPGGKLAVNSTGTGFIVSPGDVASVPVTPYIATLLDDFTSAAARVTLGFAGSGGTIQAANIEAGAVGTAALAALAVTTAKIADVNVTTAKIADAAVTAAKLAQTVLDFMCPVGTLVPFAGAVDQTNWFLCDGRAVSRSTYSALFTAIGVLYGSGDGSTTFNIPNTKGRFLRGISSYATATCTAVASQNGTFTGHPYKQSGVRVRLTSGTITGLSSATDYYVIYIDANTLAFATSRALAVAASPTKINITATSSGIISQYEDPDALTREQATTGSSAVGNSLGTVQADGNKAHTHLVGKSTPNWAGGNPGNVFANDTPDGVTSSSGGNEARPFNLAVNYLVRMF